MAEVKAPLSVVTKVGTLPADFSAATSLALILDFSTPHPRHFGAPAATASAFRVGSFEGAVAFDACPKGHRLRNVEQPASSSAVAATAGIVAVRIT